MNPNWSKQRDEPVDVGISIRIETVAMEKFWHWVDLARGEVSALGLVEETRDPKSGRVLALTVDDIYLVSQKSSEAETDMIPEGISDLILRLVSEGIDPGKLRFWIHSHGKMDVFWSSTDDACIKGLCNEEWMLSLVVNKRRDSLMRLDQYHPAHFYLGSIRWKTFLELPEDQVEILTQEFKQKVYEGPSIFKSSILSDSQPNPSMTYCPIGRQLEGEELDDEIYWAEMEREVLEEMAAEDAAMEPIEVGRNNGR